MNCPLDGGEGGGGNIFSATCSSPCDSRCEPCRICSPYLSRRAFHLPFTLSALWNRKSAFPPVRDPPPLQASLSARELDRLFSDFTFAQRDTRRSPLDVRARPAMHLLLRPPALLLSCSPLSPSVPAWNQSIVNPCVRFPFAAEWPHPGGGHPPIRRGDEQARANAGGGAHVDRNVGRKGACRPAERRGTPAVVCGVRCRHKATHSRSRPPAVLAPAPAPGRAPECETVRPAHGVGGDGQQGGARSWPYPALARCVLTLGRRDCRRRGITRRGCALRRLSGRLAVLTNFAAKCSLPLQIPPSPNRAQLLMQLFMGAKIAACAIVTFPLRASEQLVEVLSLLASQRYGGTIIICLAALVFPSAEPH